MSSFHNNNLKFETLKPGDLLHYPKKGNIVKCHFIGRFSNGEVFDSSRDRNEPFEFQLGIGEVIQCWEIVVSRMSLGEKVIVYCPPEYGYGKTGIPEIIPTNASLIFEIELLMIYY